MPLATRMPDAIGSGLLLPGQPYAAGGPLGPAAAGAGSGWEVSVLGAPGYGTQLAKMPPRMITGLQFVMQLKDKGSGTVTMSMDDKFWQSLLPGSLPAHNLLDYEHLWQVWQDGILRFEFLGETVTEQLIDPSGQRIVTVTGPGSAAVLGWAMAAPPGFPSIIYKLDAISDGFSEVNVSGQLQLDTLLWNQATPANRIALNPSGTCRLMASPSATFLGTTVFDATETLISAQVSPMVTPTSTGANLDGSQLTQFYVQDVSHAGNYFLIGLSQSSFYAQLGDPSGNQTKVIASAAAFNTVAASTTPSYQYWQISEHAGSFTAWTSADGQNWTKQFTVRHTWAATQVGFYFTAKYDVDNTQPASITSLNSNVTTSSLAGALYFNEPIMAVWMQELQAAQARGTIPFVTTRMSQSADSFGNNWSDSQSVQIQNGTDLLSLLTGHASMINADWVMQPGFVLQVGIPVTTGVITLGADRSQQIIFREARDETSKQRTRARNTIANLIAAINTDGRTVTANNTTSIANFGQREAWLQTAVQVSLADMDVVAAASVQQTSIEQLAWTLQVTPNLPGKTVFRDFQVGDWVGLERPDFSAVDAVRVMAIAVQVDSSGVETHELTLVSYLQWVQEQLQYVVGKLGGSFLSATGTTAVTGSSVGNLRQPTVFSLGMPGLSGVLTGAPAGAPLVYDPSTGTWVPAGYVNPDTGSTAQLAVSGSGGTTTVGPGTHSVSAPGAGPATAGDMTGPVAGSSVTTTPSGVTVRDPNGTSRVVIGLQPDGTVTTSTLNAPAPAAPDTPSVASANASLVVGWDGLLGGVAPLADFKWTEVHVSTSSGFTPSPATLQLLLLSAGTGMVGGLVNGTTYYVRLLARNLAGTASAPSAQVSGVPSLVLPASSIGNIGVLNANPYFTGGDAAGWTGFNGTFSVTASPPAGSAFAYAGFFTISTAGVGAAAEESGQSFPVLPSAQYLLTAWVYTAQASVTVGFDWATSAHAWLSSSTQAITVPASTWTQVTVVVTSPPLAAWAYPRIAPADGVGHSVYFEAVLALPQVPGSLVQAGTVTATQIAAASITAGQIASGTITAGQIAANTITAGQVAANTLTAAQLAAGLVYAGIVDGTTVQAHSFIGGNYFGYSGASPAADTLLISVVPGTAAVADSMGNVALPGYTAYSGSAGAWLAVSLGSTTSLPIAWWQMSTTHMNGSWTQTGQIAPAYNNLMIAQNAGQGFQFGASATPEPFVINGTQYMLNQSGPTGPRANNSGLFSDMNGTPCLWTGAGYGAALSAVSHTDPTTAPCNGNVWVNIASCNILGTDAEHGTIYELTAWGTGVWASPASALNLSFGLSGTAFQTTGIGAVAFSPAANFNWYMQAYVRCLTTGASGTWAGAMFGALNVSGANLNPTGSGSMTLPVACVAATHTISTLVNNSLNIAAQWGSASGSPNISVLGCFAGRKA